MSSQEARLLRDRALRNRARAVLDEQLARVRDDLSAKGIGARAATTVANEAHKVADAGASLAREQTGLIAGTIGALMIWKFREPIVGRIKELAGHFGAHAEPVDSQDGEPDGE
jgi:hypothetical protein